MSPWPLVIMGAALLLYAILDFHRSKSGPVELRWWHKLAATFIVGGMFAPVAHMWSDSKIAGLGGALILIAWFVANSHERKSR